MEITQVRVNLRGESKLKAFADVTFDDCFVVRGMKIIEGNKGLFIAMPSRKDNRGTFRDVAFPINQEMRKKIEDAVFAKYNEELSTASSEPERTKESDEESHGEESIPDEGEPAHES